MKRSLLFGIIFIVGSLPGFLFAQEEEPEPEYPYPKTVKETMKVEQPQKVGPRGTYYYSKKRKKNAKPNVKGVEAPTRVDSEGIYYYDSPKKKKTKGLKDLEQPIDVDSEGAYYYRRSKEKKKKKPLYGEAPGEIFPQFCLLCFQFDSQIFLFILAGGVLLYPCLAYLLVSSCFFPSPRPPFVPVRSHPQSLLFAL
ncbi:MAG: hypothetical protein AAF203_11470, partial [Pseudomonadota bacterium]